MRYGIFSDVHSNLEALKAVMAAYEDKNIDKFVSLGDTVGYGASPDPCCTLVRQKAAIAILGNHDAAVSGRMDYSYYYDLARQTLDSHASQLSEENRAWLKGLPFVLKDDKHGLAFCHGSPIDPENFEYVFTLEQARGLIPHYERLSKVTFIGHSHLTKSFMMTKDGATEMAGSKYVINPDRRYIITVGSVGQPRDFNAKACCGIYDTDAGTFEFMRTDYPVDIAAAKVFEHNDAVAFGKRLFLGV